MSDPQASPRSWFSRNWGWLLGCGCLGVILLVVVGVGGSLYLASSVMKSAQPFTVAVTAAQANDEVKAALGEPIEPGFMFEGSINVEGTSGEADMAVPLKGPNGSGKVYVVATKSAGIWTYERLEVAIDGRQGRIALEPPALESPAEATEPVE